MQGCPTFVIYTPGDRVAVWQRSCCLQHYPLGAWGSWAHKILSDDVSSSVRHFFGQSKSLGKKPRVFFWILWFHRPWGINISTRQVVIYSQSVAAVTDKGFQGFSLL